MNGRPHVLMTADAVGGVWTYALDLGRGLVRAGVRVTLAVIGPAPDALQLAQAIQAGLHVESLGGALDWTAGKEGEVAASAAELIALSAGHGPDLIHLNSPALAAFGSFPAPVLAACHSCVKTWWMAVRGETPLPDDLAWRAALMERGYGNAAALVAPSSAFAWMIHSAYGLGRPPHVVLNGRAPRPVQDENLRHSTERRGAPTRSDAGSAHPPGDQPFQATGIFTAGRLWDEGKDVATLDRAAGRLDVPAAAAGPLTGPNGHAIFLQHLSPLGALSAVELQSHLIARPIFVSPSLYEPFGLAVLEAAQQGCPLVLSDIATFRELWGGAALFFPPGDDAGLSTLLRDLSAEPHRRARVGEAARSRAARYTDIAMTQATLRLYAALSPAFARAEAAA